RDLHSFPTRRSSDLHTGEQIQSSSFLLGVSLQHHVTAHPPPPSLPQAEGARPSPGPLTVRVSRGVPTQGQAHRIAPHRLRLVDPSACHPRRLLARAQSKLHAAVHSATPSAIRPGRRRVTDAHAPAHRPIVRTP